MAKHRNRLFEMLEEGTLDAFTLARDLMGYMSDDDCKDFAEKNDIELFPDEDDEESTDWVYSDEDDVREAFSDVWEEACNANPHLRNDKPAKREAFGRFLDAACKAGEMSDNLVSSVTLEGDN